MLAAAPIKHFRERDRLLVIGLLTCCLGPTWAEGQVFCSTPNVAINNEVSDVIVVPPFPPGSVSNVNVRLTIDHPFVGALSATLKHNQGPTITLLDRPGFPDLPGGGCDGANLNVTLADEAPVPIEDACATPARAAFLPRATARTCSGFTLAAGIWSRRLWTMVAAAAWAMTWIRARSNRRMIPTAMGCVTAPTPAPASTTGQTATVTAPRTVATIVPMIPANSQPVFVVAAPRTTMPMATVHRTAWTRRRVRAAAADRRAGLERPSRSPCLRSECSPYDGA